jgi:hypothetical protein
MKQFDSEYAARKSGREMDALQESSVADQILDSISGTGAVVATIGAVLVPPAAPSLAVVSASLLGLGLFRKALKFGKPSAEQMVEEMDAEADHQYQCIWEALDGHTARQLEFEARLQGQEAESARLSALFHGLRTSDSDKHTRLARLTINCIFEDDLKPESLDGMMQAAVELNARDILALDFICSRQSKILADAEKWPEQWYDNVRRDWQVSGFEQGVATQYAGSNDVGLKSSLSRLSAFGFIIAVPPVLTQNSPGKEPYALLPDGKKFYKRLQEIAVQQ